MPGTDCLNYYLVTVCDGDKCNSTQTNSTTFVKNDLYPCVVYDFNLTVYGSESVGAYGSTNVTGKTDFISESIAKSFEFDCVFTLGMCRIVNSPDIWIPDIRCLSVTGYSILVIQPDNRGK